MIMGLCLNVHILYTGCIKTSWTFPKIACRLQTNGDTAILRPFLEWPAFLTSHYVQRMTHS